MSNHIIHSQKMKLTVESQQDWELVQAQVGEFCSNELPVLFNSVFDQVALNDTVRIKKLDLNLGDVPLNKLTEVMKEQIYFQLLNQLNAFKLSKITKENDLNKAQLKLFKNAGRFTRKSLQNSGKISDQIETYINDYEALVYYCETGLKPWWISSSISFQPSKILLTIYKNNILLFSQFIDSVKEDVVIFNRLKQLISRSLFFEQYIAPSETDGLKTHVKLYVNPILFQKMVDFWLINFKEFKTEQATVIFENWLIDFVKKNPSEGSKIKEIQQTFDAKNSGSKKQNIHSNTLSKFLATLKSNDVELKKTPVDNFSESSPKKTTVKTLPLDSLIIENAGLVIIHPFIKSLFESFKWLNDGFFLDIYSQQRAIVYLHYLVYNQYPEDESLLLLDKILCGAEPEMIIELNQITFSEEELAESESLRKAVILHWSALGTTSSAGLVENFLIRTGSLSFKDGNWNLTVEKKGIDVLLDRLPWGLTMIKLTWNKYLIQVNW